MVQMRVTPAVKYASEQVLRRIGMSMTEAMELFLRRMIIDQRIPFDVVAFDNATFTQLALDWEEESHTIIFKRTGRSRSSSRLAVRPKRE
jgi:addiction module RelB/DinJ family antitoxin